MRFKKNFFVAVLVLKYFLGLHVLCKPRDQDGVVKYVFCPAIHMLLDSNDTHVDCIGLKRVVDHHYSGIYGENSDVPSLDKNQYVILLIRAYLHDVAYALKSRNSFVSKEKFIRTKERKRLFDNMLKWTGEKTEKDASDVDFYEGLLNGAIKNTYELYEWVRSVNKIKGLSQETKTSVLFFVFKAIVRVKGLLTCITDAKDEEAWFNERRPTENPMGWFFEWTKWFTGFRDYNPSPKRRHGINYPCSEDAKSLRENIENDQMIKVLRNMLHKKNNRKLDWCMETSDCIMWKYDRKKGLAWNITASGHSTICTCPFSMPLKRKVERKPVIYYTGSNDTNIEMKIGHITVGNALDEDLLNYCSPEGPWSEKCGREETVLFKGSADKRITAKPFFVKYTQDHSKNIDDYDNYNPVENRKSQESIEVYYGTTVKGGYTNARDDLGLVERKNFPMSPKWNSNKEITPTFFTGSSPEYFYIADDNDEWINPPPRFITNITRSTLKTHCFEESSKREKNPKKLVPERKEGTSNSGEAMQEDSSENDDDGENDNNPKPNPVNLKKPQNLKHEEEDVYYQEEENTPKKKQKASSKHDTENDDAWSSFVHMVLVLSAIGIIVVVIVLGLSFKFFFPKKSRAEREIM